MTLKTLKEIFERTGSTTGNFENLMKDFNLEENEASEAQHICSHLHEDLKQEAIKWAKETIRKIKSYGNPKINTTQWCNKQSMKTQLHFIKTFFNITEDDLK